jgi:hypothetical protein
VLDIDESIVSELGIGPAMLPRSRANGFRNMLETARSSLITLIPPLIPLGNHVPNRDAVSRRRDHTDVHDTTRP